MKWRNSTIVLMVGLTAMMTACSATQEAAPKSTSPSGSQTAAGNEPTGELSFWGGAHLVSAAQAVMEDYASKHPDLKVSYQKFPYAEYPTKMKLQLSTNQGEPDIMIIHDFLGQQFIKSGWLMDLTGSFDTKDLLPGSLDAVTKDGKFYGIPNQANLGAFLYRKDIFDKLGLQAPKTMDEYLNAAQKLKENGYFMGVLDPSEARNPFYRTLLQMGGTLFDPQGNVILNEPKGKGVEALNLVKKMVDGGYFAPVKDLSQEFWTQVNAGKIAGLLTVTSDAANYAGSLDPQGKGGMGKWSYAQPPKLAADGPVSFYHNSEYYVINKNTKNPEGAKALIKYLAMSDEAGKAFSEIDKPGLVVRMANNYIPSLKKLTQDSVPWKAFGDQKLISEEAKVLVETAPKLAYTDERSPEADRIMNVELAKFFKGGVSAEATIKSISDQVKNIKH
ncbi:ABC transporter substrate-binding protein [Paenibacillus piri]|uniref:Sugar ABC transporter substrate-binding protein n=1 Tax=Paenibacillus piri TaxID=2547395 RepID=A0A4R5KKX2_9BACL|nr:sugar ABC transporter substrate-binding protein [Paenibacillus piri]TDF95505.1 sugar ABC transporter substrate-binding protein [Paenibacillus piri]